jgi:hypothetical protein
MDDDSLIWDGGLIKPPLSSNNFSSIYKKLKDELKPPIDDNLWHWHNVLVHIKYLPDLIIERYKFVPNTLDEKQYIKEKKWSYTAFADWLNILVPGDKLPPRIWFSRIKSS